MPSAAPQAEARVQRREHQGEGQRRPRRPRHQRMPQRLARGLQVGRQHRHVAAPREGARQVDARHLRLEGLLDPGRGGLRRQAQEGDVHAAQRHVAGEHRAALPLEVHLLAERRVRRHRDQLGDGVVPLGEHVDEVGAEGARRADHRDAMAAMRHGGLTPRRGRRARARPSRGSRAPRRCSPASSRSRGARAGVEHGGRPPRAPRGAAAGASSECSSSIATERIAASGLARSWPAMSGAEPCTGS